MASKEGATSKKLNSPMALRLEGFNGKSMDFRPIFAG
jgi:hypothetical protein